MANDNKDMQTECPLCCESLSLGDQVYSLHCPTPTCRFNYCSNCIRSMQQSAADGYQEASDGSRQMKISVQCPQCRAKYQCQQFPSEMIVQSVLILRTACEFSHSGILTTADSELPATELKRKHNFLQSVELEALHDAHRRLSVYQQEVGTTNYEKAVADLDWDFWTSVLSRTASPTTVVSQKNSGDSSPSSGTSSSPAAVLPFRDPTLFCGLEDFMSVSEQEFVTQLFISNQPAALAQAAHILANILEFGAVRQKAAQTALEELSLVAPARSTTSTTTRSPPVDLHKIRQKYPLPRRMPRCVTLPAYDPESSRGGILSFQRPAVKTATLEERPLILAGVNGPAGKVGLRKGDVVTHVQGEVVHNQAEYIHAVKQVLTNNWDSAAQEQRLQQLFVVVNADEETAELLYKRAQEMKEAKINRV